MRWFRVRGYLGESAGDAASELSSGAGLFCKVPQTGSHSARVTSSPVFPDMFYCHLPTRNHFCFKRAMEGAISFNFSDQHRYISPYLSSQTAEIAPYWNFLEQYFHCWATTPPTSHPAPPQMGAAKVISVPSSTIDERETFSTWTLERGHGVRLGLSTLGPAPWSENASFYLVPGATPCTQGHCGP